MLGEVVSQVGDIGGPQHMKLFLVYSIPHPTEVHVYGMGVLLFDIWLAMPLSTCAGVGC